MLFTASASTARAGEALPLRDGVPAVTVAADREAAWAMEPETAVDAKAPISPGKAVLYSLLLPGLGDYKLGNKGRATGFFAAEGLIWISYAVFEVQGHQREDEYQDLAVRFAGVTRTGHSDDFYATLRDYDNSEDYAADVKYDGRIELSGNGAYPDQVGAEALEQYFVANRLEDYEPWQWTSTDRRLQYSEVRSSSKTSYRRADYMIAAAAANRVVSAIVAFASARGMQKSEDVGYHLDFAPAARGVDVTLSFTRSF
ncbi:MAG TPA: hypothetical protein VF247_10780 [Candidatus Krumholzibacteria bacterium]